MGTVHAAAFPVFTPQPLMRRTIMGQMLDDKVAVITGSGGGIGRELAHAFAARGASVIVNDPGRTKDGDPSAHVVVAEIIAAGGKAAASTDSVADWDSANRIVECALSNFGGIDCVVNNAGIVRDSLFFDMSPQDWRAVVDVHLNGSFYVARAAAPHFKAKGSGAYIHMTSTSGLIGAVGQANYSAAKMGLVGLSKSIALDMAKYNVRSNCIVPWAWTSMTANIPETTENWPLIQKMKRMHPATIAPLAVYLASDAAVNVSGQIFGVRANEIYFFSQIRMIRSVHRSDGWTPEAIAAHAVPAFEASFFPNVPALELMPWDPL
jgi:NAD(P)-dependent dehydrogenase (short-subunit alcohol dehydrogenase family)